MMEVSGIGSASKDLDGLVLKSSDVKKCVVYKFSLMFCVSNSVPIVCIFSNGLTF